MSKFPCKEIQSQILAIRNSLDIIEGNLLDFVDSLPNPDKEVF